MDPLRKIVFDAIRAEKTGDEKIDGCNYTASQHVYGILKKFTETCDRVEKNKGELTGKGKRLRVERAGQNSLKELNEIREKSSWQEDIEKIERKFDEPGEMESDIKLLVREFREREAREYMREFKGDSMLFAAEFLAEIEAGDPVICGAICHAPISLKIDPALEDLAREEFRKSRNPSAADRLSTLTEAQKIHTDLFAFAEAELGIDAAQELKLMIDGKAVNLDTVEGGQR